MREQKSRTPEIWYKNVLGSSAYQRKIAMKPVITDEDGRIVSNDKDAAQILPHHFGTIFSRQVYANCLASLDIIGHYQLQSLLLKH